MEVIDFWEACSRWWSGDTNPDLRMWLIWEWPLRYWGRLGKSLQFSGGLIVIFDLIGSERMQRIEKRVQLTANTVTKFGRILASWKEEPRDPLIREWKEATTGARILLVAVVCTIMAAPVLIIATDLLLQTNNVLAGFIYGSVLAIIATIAVESILLILHIPIRALAWIFRSDRQGHPMRWVAFVLAFVGFGFDFLAS